MVDLKEKAQQPEYQPLDEKLAKFIQWLSFPSTFKGEGHLQKMFDYPEGSAWDFLSNALVKKKFLHQKRESKRTTFHTFTPNNFTDEQIIILKIIKDVFASNIALKREIDIREIFGNPIYERLIGSYESVNQKFDGKINLVINDF